MATWHVEFEKRFTVALEADTREQALAAAVQTIEDREIDYTWETGEWEAWVQKQPLSASPDHGISDGVIVNIEDARCSRKV